MITIRPFTETDLKRLGGLQPEGWVSVEPSFQFFMQQTFCFPYVAERHGEIIGTANGIQNGRSAWLSHIIVAKSCRRQGIGSMLTEFIMNEMRNKGNKRILLVASAMGEKLYPKFGFRTVGYYNFYQGNFNVFHPKSPKIRSAMFKDLNPIIKLDKKMSGEDRSAILKLHIKNAYVYEDSFPRRILGFYMPTFGEGLIVAKNNDAGIHLFNLRLSTSPERIVVPQENNVVNEYILSLGYTSSATAPRMVWGKNVNWRPRMMFGRVGGWFG